MPDLYLSKRTVLWSLGIFRGANELYVSDLYQRAGGSGSRAFSMDQASALSVYDSAMRVSTSYRTHVFKCTCRYSPIKFRHFSSFNGTDQFKPEAMVPQVASLPAAAVVLVVVVLVSRG